MPGDSLLSFAWLPVAGAAQYHLEFPQYGFDGHKGYGTAEHLAALREHGACPQHRKTFSPVTQVLAGVHA